MLDCHREFEVCRFAWSGFIAKSRSSDSRGRFVIAKSRSLISRGREFSKMLVNGLYFPAYEHFADSRGISVPRVFEVCRFAGSCFIANLRSADSRGRFVIANLRSAVSRGLRASTLQRPSIKHSPYSFSIFQSKGRSAPQVRCMPEQEHRPSQFPSVPSKLQS